MNEETGSVNNPFDKEGLKGAIEFTKILLALSGGAIAFILQPTGGGLAGGTLTGGLALLSLLALSICVISGLFVISGTCVLLAHREYDLENKYVKIPGLINVFSFAGGFLLLAIYIAAKIFSGMGPS
jgi:hypothetical protein